MEKWRRKARRHTPCNAQQPARGAYKINTAILAIAETCYANKETVGKFVSRSDANPTITGG